LHDCLLSGKLRNNSTSYVKLFFLERCKSQTPQRSTQILPRRSLPAEYRQVSRDTCQLYFMAVRKTSLSPRPFPRSSQILISVTSQPVTQNTTQFIHPAVCLTTGPQPLPKQFLHTVRATVSSFNLQYPLFPLRSSSSCLRLLLRLPVIYNLPSTAPSITCF
jgi:hypothetical protein